MDIAEAVEVAVYRGIRDAKRDNLNPARRALEIASYVSLVTAARPYKVDGAELVGFIKNNDPLGDAEAGDLASAIVERFRLEDLS
jgi:hypothetical protein